MIALAGGAVSTLGLNVMVSSGVVWHCMWGARGLGFLGCFVLSSKKERGHIASRDEECLAGG